MANSKIQLWISPTNGKVYDSLNISADPPSLAFTQGDSVEVELHLCKAIDNVLVEVDFPVDATVKLAVGKRDTIPASGTYTISCGGQNTVLNYNASASAIQTALNVNPTVLAEGGVDVIDLSSVMKQVRYRTTGVKTPMTIDSTLLFPTSYGKVIPVRAGSSTVRAMSFIKVAQSPVIYQTAWESIESIEPVVATITTIGVGHKRIEFTPAPSIGSWTLTTTPNVWRSWRLQPNWGTVSQALPATFWSASTTFVAPAVATDDDFQFIATDADVTALKMYASSDYFQPHVQRVDDGIYDVIWNYDPIWMPPDATYNSLVDSFRNAPVGYTYPLSVNPAGLKPRKGFTATINLNSAEIEYLLAGASKADASLEIEVSTSGTKQTILMTDCSIKNDMIDGYAYTPMELDGSSGIAEAPNNGIAYVRQNKGWTPLTEVDGGSY